MTDIETSTVCEEGYHCSSHVGEFELSIDATGEEGPTANQALVATYASCYLPALRVAGQQRGHDDLGKLQIDASADLDDDDDLAAIRWDLHVELDLSDEELEEIVDRGKEICHVHSAVRPELRAEITAHGDAF
ncbi:putative redox protein, regulator of disulfide bond formation [Halalkaliarchaeum desulfuricum]|uniref:Putative redox protein, regulator of disulfide bond formation n=1 Tax=Halalkaliarchaeum desulfuricum TaxID=2055893 RepID=A0A343THJ1_9EURY|nr:OsmC family protein [Halalkaliarchaeum desulfuricum]AUX08563.1 putative redox protein, regulator of disulfide bond formation [Halalkaliarchaeum desulfuricum]